MEVRRLIISWTLTEVLYEIPSSKLTEVVTLLICVWEVADWNPSHNQLPNRFFSIVFQICEVAKWIEMGKNQVGILWC